MNRRRSDLAHPQPTACLLPLLLMLSLLLTLPAIAQEEKEEPANEAVMAYLQPQLEAGAGGEPPSTGESPLSGPERALILVNTVPGPRLSTEQLTQVFAIPEMPLLDVFLGPTSRLHDRVREHRNLSARQRLERYHSLQLPRPRVEDPEDERSFWVRRIHGFMHRQAEGMERRRINRQ